MYLKKGIKIVGEMGFANLVLRPKEKVWNSLLFRPTYSKHDNILVTNVPQ